MISLSPANGNVDPTSATLIAEALVHGTTGHGTQFFSPTILNAVPMRRQGEVIQVHCLKRRRWLEATPEEIVRQLTPHWIVKELGYALERIAVEWAIQMGSDAERERADIVVFSDDAQTDPYIIVEVKRPSVTEGVDQLRSYLRWTGCFFGFWCNGDDVVSLLREEDPSPARRRIASGTFRAIGNLDGLFAKTRKRAIFLGSYTWVGRSGTVVLAPSYPGGGEQGDHLIFRWRQSNVGCAVGLHGWEPLSHAFATLRAMVRSI